MKCTSPSAGVISHKDGGLWCLWAITACAFGDLALLLERPSGCWGYPHRTAVQTLTYHTLWLCPSRPAYSPGPPVHSATGDWQLPLPRPQASCLFMTLTYGTSVGGWRELLAERVQRVPIRALLKQNKCKMRGEQRRPGGVCPPACAPVSAHSPCRDAARR